jgi:hypothetical protein
MKRLILILFLLFIPYFVHSTPIDDLKKLIEVYNIQTRIEENLEYNNLYIYIEETSDKNFTMISNAIAVAIYRSIDLIGFDIDKYNSFIVSNGEGKNSPVIVFSKKDIKNILIKNNLKRIGNASKR